MARISSAEVAGARLVERTLQTMGKEGVKVVSKATRKGALIIKKTAKRTSAFQDRSGRLRKAIRSRKVRSRKTQISYNIGADKTAPHAHLVEKGHALVVVTPKGKKKNLGTVRPHPWLKPAFEQSKDEAWTVILQETWTGLKALTK